MRRCVFSIRFRSSHKTRIATGPVFGEQISMDWWAGHQEIHSALSLRVLRQHDTGIQQ